MPLPSLPEGWSPIHSLAYLLLGVALMDGVLRTEEIGRAVDLLARYDGVSEDDARLCVGVAHTYFTRVTQDLGRDGWLASLNHHSAILANRFDRYWLRTVVHDMIGLAGVDGDYDEDEVRFIHGLAAAWGVDGEA